MAYREACLSWEIQILRRKHILELVENKNTEYTCIVVCVEELSVPHCVQRLFKKITGHHWMWNGEQSFMTVAVYVD